MQIIRKIGVKLGIELTESLNEFQQSQRIVDLIEYKEDIDYNSLNMRGTTKHLMIGSFYRKP